MHSKQEKDINVEQQSDSSPLNEKHRKECFSKRKLDKPWVEASCRSISLNEASEYLGYPSKSAGILMTGASHQIQFKPDTPWKSQRGEKASKYRSPKGTDYDAFLPAHPEKDDYWTNYEALKKECFVYDSNPYVLVTEGVFKAICACSIGIPTVGLLGVEMGLTSPQSDPQGKRFLVSSLETLALKGFNFVVGFDADIAKKSGVKSALYKLCFHLEKIGSKVQVLPEWDAELGKGIDDYIVENSAETFRIEVMNKALSFEGWKSRNLEQQANQKVPEIVLAEQLSKRFKKSLRWDSETHQWWQYNDGFWGQVSEETMERVIYEAIREKNYYQFTPTYVSNTHSFLKLELPMVEWPDTTHLIPFKNGVLDINTLEFKDNNPSFYVRWQLPREYKKDNLSFPKIEEWMTWLSNGEEQTKKKLFCFCAAVLRRMGEVQKFLHLIGTGSDGKSTFTNLLSEIVGEGNYSTMDISDLNDSEPLAQIHGKSLVIFPDQDSAGKKVSNFKKITGGDPIRGRKLYKSGFNFVFKGLVVVTSNTPIFHSGSGRWLTRRCLMIQCKNHVEGDQVNPNLIDDLKKEAQPFTNYLLSIPPEEIKSVLKGDAKQKINAALWENQVRADGLAAWVEDWLIHSPDSWTRIGANAKEWEGREYVGELSTLFGSYCAHCKMTNRTGLTKANFSANLIDLLNRTLAWGVEKKKKALGYVIMGVKVRRFEDHTTPTTYEILLEQEKNPTPQEKEVSENECITCTDEVEQGFKRLPVSIQNIFTKVCMAQPGDKETTPDIADPPSQVWGGHFSDYPHTTSDDNAAKRNQACFVHSLLIADASIAQFEGVIDEYGENRVLWVCTNIMTPNLRDSIKNAMTVRQLSIYDQE